MARTEDYDRRRISGSRTKKSQEKKSSGSSSTRATAPRSSPGRERTEQREYQETTASQGHVPGALDRATQAGYGDTIVEQQEPQGAPQQPSGGGAGGGGGFPGGGGGGGASAADAQRDAARNAIEELRGLFTGGDYRAAEDLLIGAIDDAQQRDIQAVNQNYDQLVQNIASRDAPSQFSAMAGGETGPTSGDDQLSQRFREIGQQLHGSEQQYRSERERGADDARAFAREEVRAAARAGRTAANMKAAERANSMADQIVQLAVQHGLDIPDLGGMMGSNDPAQSMGGI